MTVELGELRRSQIITTYGPGAVIDIRAGGHGGTAISVIVAGLDEWDNSAGYSGSGLQHPQTISEPRLQRMLGVQGFRLPPVVAKDSGSYLHGERIPGIRFPSWLHCPRCHVLKQAANWQEYPGDPARYCPECSHREGKHVHVIPARFISCCDRGHVDEFPWSWWARHNGPCRNKLRFRLKSAGAGLAGLMLSCPVCGGSRSMDGCFSPAALAVLPCSGRRIWLGDEEKGCDAKPRAMLRGASNVYFSTIVSSLDIPPWSDRIQQRIGVLDWNRLAAAPHDQKRLEIIKANDLDVRMGSSAEVLLAAINARIAMLTMQTDETLRFDEYKAFLNGVDGEQSEFEVQDETLPDELHSLFGQLVRVSRLREVRVLRSFTRIKPPADWRVTGSNHFAPLSIHRKDWLPAIEVRGEGIFLAFNLDTLGHWEKKLSGDPYWAARLQGVDNNYRAEFIERHGTGVTIPRRISFRFLLVHSFAHALMRQMALSSGYSTASLRERIYCDIGVRNMAGVLIYTASADADGTLGGLSRQATSQRMLDLVRSAIQSMAWCSSDPLCIDGRMATSEALNPAACHSCLLAPETSCEEYNRLLDRAMLVGSPRDRDAGYFSRLLQL